MGFLASLTGQKKTEETVRAVAAVIEKGREDMEAALNRLSEAAERNIRATVDRTMEENARLTGRNRPR